MMAWETNATTAPQGSGTGVGENDLVNQYREVRRLTEALCAPLETEDYVVQSMPDASPAKWHLAHTTWFFETFVLSPALVDYQPVDPRFGFLFNSYYNAVGERLPRPNRGLLSRPTVDEVYGYRHAVDDRLLQFLGQADEGQLRQWCPVLVLGLNHEQQHQELILTDIKHLFGCHSFHPAYKQGEVSTAEVSAPVRWVTYPQGLRRIGHDGHGFAFDNEGPRHRVFLEAFQIASRLATAGEYCAFLDDGGYHRPEWWLSDGWNAIQEQRWQAPLYWEKQGEQWWVHTLNGMRRLTEAEPVCHVSYYEADAFARWSGARLPTEAEWEVAAGDCPIEGNFLEGGHFHPVPVQPAREGEGLQQFFGDVWEWTGSSYLPYPGYRPAAGALGEHNGNMMEPISPTQQVDLVKALSEYNAKFMCGQFVLRGGSCVTPQSHIRRTYRNFFPPDARWQFSGLRLARDAGPAAVQARDGKGPLP